jgi:GDP-4-dehydro-6-deoxy-D-mannose reductase
MNVLITGITGFAGSHLAEYILAEHPGARVHGIVRWRSRMDNIAHLTGKIELHEADLKDMVSLKKALAASRPDKIFHLAAQSFVPTSWRLPAETFQINSVGQINLFEAILDLKLDPRIQIAGSSEEYGMVHADEVPMKETNPLRPLSPYAVSKVAQDLLGYQYFKSYGLRAIRTRGFNHTGPRRGDVFVTSNFADVRDMVRAYWLATEKAEDGDVYNVGTGGTISMHELLDMLLALTKVKVRVQVDPERLRPSDVQILQADPSKFQKQTGWVPTIPFEKTLRDLLDYWRERV